MKDFEGDLYFGCTENGGDFRIEDGEFLGDEKFDTAILLSLFGGNEDDAGNSDETNSWWGNFVKDDVGVKFRSTFQNFVRGSPLTARNLQKAIECIETDLKWLTDDGLADEINVNAKIEGKNRVGFVVNLDGAKEEFAVGW